jgi:hypothetical protein
VYGIPSQVRGVDAVYIDQNHAHFEAQARESFRVPHPIAAPHEKPSMKPVPGGTYPK